MSKDQQRINFTINIMNELKTELIRKSIHCLIALTPFMANINHRKTVVILLCGTAVYSCLEFLRISGASTPVISPLTALASRSRDHGHFVLGPVTLGIGAILALVLYPPPASSLAIYALAFGDSAASLVGKSMGRLRPAFLHGKSIEGSIACFASVYIIASLSGYRYSAACSAAITATIVETLPLNDFDNIAIPLAVGMIVSYYTG